jgi:hypothetical protein
MRNLKGGRVKCPCSVTTENKMDDFDDVSIEESSSFDFVEEMNEPDKFKFDEYLNSNIDY